jgi:hypothetical protein
MALQVALALGGVVASLHFAAEGLDGSFAVALPAVPPEVRVVLKPASASCTRWLLGAVLRVYVVLESAPGAVALRALWALVSLGGGHCF